MIKKSRDNSAKHSGSGSIIRHPAFPAVVALWFMVLLGFGGLLIPVALLERLAEISHLSSLVPAAAPPLGFTAKLIVALVLGAIGAGLGLKVARRAGGGSGDEAELDTPPMSRTRFNIATDHGTDATETTPHPQRRRRALSINDLGPAIDQISPYAEPQDHYAPAYTPAPDAPVMEVLPPEPGFQEWRRAEDVFEEAAAIEMPVVEPDPEAIEVAQTVEPISEPEELEPVESPEWLELETAVEIEPVVEPEPTIEVEPVAELEIEPVVEPEPTIEVEPVVEPEPTIEVEPVAEPEVAVEVEPAVEPEPAVAVAVAVASDPATNPVLPAPPSTPLDDLDITQLVERFADTVRRRREWLASTRHLRPSPVRPLVLEPEPVALPPVTSQAAQPVEEPTAKRPPVFDWLKHLNIEARDDSPSPGFSVPLHTAAFVKAASEQDLDEPDMDLEPEPELDDEGDAYGSLIEMKNPFALPRSDFIRIEEDETDLEVETDPAHEQEKAQERPDTVDAETSLRAALAKLQQLSGNP
ncbi:MAG: hypothetical protein J7493_06390 [Porphyrobacter sp.]|nr:hypothetical protein [Porphyrobacter sp.]